MSTSGWMYRPMVITANHKNNELAAMSLAEIVASSSSHFFDSSKIFVR